MEQIPPADLIPMDLFLKDEPIVLDLVYADADHPRNIFKTQIYQSDARFWTHKDLGAVTVLAARILNDQFGYTLELKDSLRTVEAQQAMQETDIVKANPHWCEGPYPLLSAPGMRGHPRAMAIDTCVLDYNGNEINMGTPFDYLTENDDHNPASRNYKDLPLEVLKNRENLEQAFVQSAQSLNIDLLPLPSEWWDFRIPNKISKRYEPLYDKNLPPQMQMTIKTDNDIQNFNDAHFDKLKIDLLNRIENLHK